MRQRDPLFWERVVFGIAILVAAILLVMLADMVVAGSLPAK
jgi:hypothetical protein